MPRNTMPAVNRRDFVRTTLAATVGVGGSLGVFACTSAPRSVPIAWRAPALLDALGEEQVRRIGTMWIEQHPAERSLESLSSALRQRVAYSASAEAFEEAITEDFDANRIVIVDGWMLAVTEVRQCALYHLSHV